METNDLDNFGEISLDCDSFENNVGCLKKPFTKRYRPSPKRLLPPLRPIEFEKYVKVNGQNKIQILNRSTFHRIEKPIIIIFNHFREKCAYHIKCLDKLYQLALKYDERIEFIAADIMDIDIMNPRWYSINLLCRMGNPEKVSAIIYAIDEQKRIHEHLNADKSQQSLINLCEHLLNGSLFQTEPVPDPNNRTLVKICVHQNYKEIVTDSNKHILLIVGLGDYNEINDENEFPYETLADQLKPCDVEVVYINAEKNYVPFALEISYYPSLIFIPHSDNKEYFESLPSPFTQENIINFIKSYIQDPELFLEQKRIELRKNSYQPLNIMPDFRLNFSDLQQYLEANCQHYLKVFQRPTFQRSNRFIIIAFLDFQGNKCLASHLKWLDIIYQVAVNLSSPREYFIADFKDIDVINPLWRPEDFTKHNPSQLTTTPKVFGIDLNKNKFVLKEFKSPASLFYFAYSLTNGELYISEPWPYMNEEKLVKTCIADSLNLSITTAKTNILLAIYYSNTEGSIDFLKFLEEIARDLENIPIKVMKIDSRLNCIPLELDNSMYPIIYYIPQSNKTNRVQFPSENFSKENILEFVRQNIRDNKV